MLWFVVAGIFASKEASFPNKSGMYTLYIFFLLLRTKYSIKGHKNILLIFFVGKIFWVLPHLITERCN